MSKRQERRARRLAQVEAKTQEELARPVLCVDCSYKSGRDYWHDRPECAGAELPEERPAPPQKKQAWWPRLKGWKNEQT